MKPLRKYGTVPFKIAVLHGGPGAPGEMAPVARELSNVSGVLEPLQSATTIDGQVQELKIVLETHSTLPVTLVGWSWGAMLGFIFTAKHPSFVKKLILICSGVYEEEYALDITNTRLARLTEADRGEALSLMIKLNDPACEDKNMVLARLGKLIFKADLYNPLPYDNEVIEYQYEVFHNVWSQASELRHSGKLINLGKKITCPVVALHGDYDPHPYEGVKVPLARVVKDFRFILLPNCGHQPWLEKAVKARFYDILKNEIGY